MSIFDYIHAYLQAKGLESEDDLSLEDIFIIEAAFYNKEPPIFEVVQ